MNLNDAASVAEQFPYLDLTEADLLRIVEEDKVTRDNHFRITEFEGKIVVYQERIDGHQQQLDKLADQKSELEAQLRAVDTQSREIRGAITSDRYHIQLAKRRITERKSAINRRRKFLYRDEINRRLRRLGREFKLGVGRRGKSGEGVVDLK